MAFCRGSKYSPLPQCFHLQSILNDQGRTLLAYLRTFQELWEEKYFCCTQDDNVRYLLCSIVQKGTHKWNMKRYYNTVLCGKSAADAANLSIFTLRNVHCGLRCATSSWGHIEYMIADAWARWLRRQCARAIPGELEGRRFFFTPSRQFRGPLSVL